MWEKIMYVYDVLVLVYGSILQIYQDTYIHREKANCV